MRILFLIIIISLVFIACDQPTEKARACVNIDECKDGEICKDGFCKVPIIINNDCVEDEDCPDNFFCNVQSVCEKKICTDDAYCGSDKICENEKCIIGCRKNSDCKSDESCNLETLKCGEKKDCRDNSDSCEQGYKCNISNGECEINNSCTTINDCPENYECKDSNCVEKAKCTTNEQCTVNGEICKNSGYCGPDTGCENDAYCLNKDATKPYCNIVSAICYECVADEHCPTEGEGCNQSTHTCSAGASGACENDSDCGLNKRCNKDTDPHTCESIYGIECTSDADCTDLTNGKCNTDATPKRCVQCLLDTDCAETEVCNSNTNLCESQGSGSACTTDSDCNALGGEKCLNSSNTDCAGETDCTCKNPNGGGDGTGACDTLEGWATCKLFGMECTGFMSGDCVPKPDPCEGVTCSEHSTCNDGNCNCDNGYKKSANLCVPLCEGVTCGNHGTCSVENNVEVCTCEAGFRADGLNCIDACTGVSCSDHGECTKINSIPTCNCTDNGYYADGLECKNPCIGACSGHGTCSSTNLNDASCDCDTGYRADGLTCIGLCEGETCNNHGTCIIPEDTAECRCEIGYAHDGGDKLRCVEHCDLDQLSNPINSSSNSATLITAGDYLNLSTENDSCEKVEDWYKINLEANTKITVKILFSHANGDLDLKFYDENNSDFHSFLAESISADDNESLSYRITTTGTYYIQVRYGRNRYDMKIRTAAIKSSNPGAVCTEDIACFGDNSAECVVNYTVNGYCTEECTTDGATCMDSGICHNEICFKKCAPGSDSSCGRDDLVCKNVEGGICVAKCYQNSDCYTNKCNVTTGHCEYDYRECDPVRNTGCSAGYKCYHYHGEDSYCYPTGDKEEGDACSSSKECGLQLGCIGGTCTEICRPWEGDCPGWPTCSGELSNADYRYCD